MCIHFFSHPVRNKLICFLLHGCTKILYFTCTGSRTECFDFSTPSWKLFSECYEYDIWIQKVKQERKIAIQSKTEHNEYTSPPLRVTRNVEIPKTSGWNYNPTLQQERWRGESRSPAKPFWANQVIPLSVSAVSYFCPLYIWWVGVFPFLLVWTTPFLFCHLSLGAIKNDEGRH